MEIKENENSKEFSQTSYNAFLKSKRTSPPSQECIKQLQFGKHLEYLHLFKVLCWELQGIQRIHLTKFLLKIKDKYTMVIPSKVP